MRTFLVAYDLAKPTLNQAYIANAIMNLGCAWARPLQNVWYLRTEAGSGAEIEARLACLLGDDDGLLVQEARGEAVLANTGVRWFRQRRPVILDAGEAPGTPATFAQDNVVPFVPAAAPAPALPKAGPAGELRLAHS